MTLCMIHLEEMTSQPDKKNMTLKMKSSLTLRNPSLYFVRELLGKSQTADKDVHCSNAIEIWKFQKFKQYQQVQYM